MPPAMTGTMNRASVVRGCDITQAVSDPTPSDIAPVASFLTARCTREASDMAPGASPQVRAPAIRLQKNIVRPNWATGATVVAAHIAKYPDAAEIEHHTTGMK